MHLLSFFYRSQSAEVRRATRGLRWCGSRCLAPVISSDSGHIVALVRSTTRFVDRGRSSIPRVPANRVDPGRRSDPARTLTGRQTPRPPTNAQRTPHRPHLSDDVGLEQRLQDRGAPAGHVHKRRAEPRRGRRLHRRRRRDHRLGLAARPPQARHHRHHRPVPPHLAQEAQLGVVGAAVHLPRHPQEPEPGLPAHRAQRQQAHGRGPQAAVPDRGAGQGHCVAQGRLRRPHHRLAGAAQDAPRRHEPRQDHRHDVRREPDHHHQLDPAGQGQGRPRRCHPHRRRCRHPGRRRRRQGRGGGRQEARGGDRRRGQRKEPGAGGKSQGQAGRGGGAREPRGDRGAQGGGDGGRGGVCGEERRRGGVRQVDGAGACGRRDCFSCRSSTSLRSTWQSRSPSTAPCFPRWPFPVMADHRRGRRELGYCSGEPSPPPRTHTTPKSKCQPDTVDVACRRATSQCLAGIRSRARPPSVGNPAPAACTDLVPLSSKHFGEVDTPCVSRLRRKGATAHPTASFGSAFASSAVRPHTLLPLRQHLSGPERKSPQMWGLHPSPHRPLPRCRAQGRCPGFGGGRAVPGASRAAAADPRAGRVRGLRSPCGRPRRGRGGRWRAGEAHRRALEVSLVCH